MAITDPFNATNTQTCTYSHDDLARIASGNCGSAWSQTFSYDAFGNLTKAGSNSFNPGYNTVTNRMSSGATYDSNGDVLTDSLHSYAWDVETRPTTIDTVTVTYDALGRMVEQTKAGASTEIQYAPTGFEMQTMNGSSFLKAFVPMPGGTEEVWQATGASPYYRHADWVGSSRFASTTSRTMYNDLAYAPFGEQYAQSGSTGVTDTSFAGNNEDTSTNLYDAQFREYEIYGRWPSPDPAGIAAASPANPQSWNRYAYVLNNPISLTDRTGWGTAGMCRSANKPPCSNQMPGNVFLIDDTFGCDPISGWADSSCQQALNWFENPDWSPWDIHFTGTLYGKYYDKTFSTWAQYADWSTGIAALSASQCYQAAMAIAGNQGLSSISGTCTSSAFGLVYSFLWSDNGDSEDESVNAAAVAGWSDPITSFHGGADSWYLGGFLNGFFDTMHLVDSIDGGLDINAHIDPFGPFNPLHYIVQIPLGALNSSGQSWSGTCSAVGGCSFP